MNTGAACPGLIEASAAAGSASAGDANTGAACPGLIEADGGGRGAERFIGEYRGSLPRPH